MHAKYWGRKKPTSILNPHLRRIAEPRGPALRGFCLNVGFFLPQYFACILWTLSL